MTDEEPKREDFEILKSSNLPSNLSFKIIIIGDSGVGKTCLSERATKGTFTGILAPTVGFDFYSLLVKYKDKLIKLEIWDTCGQEAYRSLITSYYKHCYLAIIVYAINNKKSFQNIPEWIRQCRENSEPNIKLILIGNKNDLDEDEREVEINEGEKIKENYEMELFLETSAKAGSNVEELFYQTTKIIYKNFEEENKKKSTIDYELIEDLKSDGDSNKNKTCCKN